MDTSLVSGAIGVERLGNIEMVEHKDTTGVCKSTYDKLPEEVKSYLSEKSWLLYRFRQPQWSLKVQARKHPAAVGYTATIESALFNTTLNRKGAGETTATLMVRNFGGSFLELEIAPGTGKLKELSIDGEEETPIALSRKKILRIPLRKPEMAKTIPKTL